MEAFSLKLILVITLCFGMTDSEKRCAKQRHAVRYPSPRPGSPGMFCSAYEHETCCTNITDAKIRAGGEMLVDGTRWDECGKLSTECSRYHHLETCRYECSPNLGKYIVKKPHHDSDDFRGIPICASFCDTWYEACKNDFVCGKNWNKDYRWDKEGNHCVKPCGTYEYYYGSGRELCNNMWGDAMMYGTDKSTCIDV